MTHLNGGVDVGVLSPGGHRTTAHRETLKGISGTEMHRDAQRQKSTHTHFSFSATEILMRRKVKRKINK